MKTQADFGGSHIPVLHKLLSTTSGPVLELGCGWYSTTYLHWACWPNRRRLVSYESDRHWTTAVSPFRSSYHQIMWTDNWDSVDLSEPWSVALVDHHPNLRRVKDIERLTHAEYVVVHDIDGPKRRYHYHRVYPMFKYSYIYTGEHPNTGVFSNVHSLEGFDCEN